MNKIVCVAEDISVRDFPHGGTTLEKLGFIVNYGVLAPSIYNSQPWTFNVSGDVIELYADRNRLMPVRDPEARQLTISCGAALFYIRLAARRFGYSTRVEILPEPDTRDLLARVSLVAREEASAEEQRLFAAIATRRTNRLGYEARAISRPVLDDLKGAATQEGCMLSMLEGEDARHRIATLVAKADRVQWSNKRFRQELAGMVRTGVSVSYDGVQSADVGLSDVTPYAVPQVIRTANLGNERAAKDIELIASSPVVAVLGTGGDTRADWLSAGQALSRLLLQAGCAGVHASFLNQPIEVAHLRPGVRALSGSAAYPQLVQLGSNEATVRPPKLCHDMSRQKALPSSGCSTL